MSDAQAVPSTLPPEGLNLGIELDRYRDWLIDQALLQQVAVASAARTCSSTRSRTVFWNRLHRLR